MAEAGHTALRAFGIEPPQVYRDACKKLANAMLPAEPYSRPMAKSKGHVGDNASRGTFVRDDNGVKQFSTESKPNLLRSMLSLQRLPDLCSYGLLGLGRDRGPILGKSR